MMRYEKGRPVVELEQGLLPVVGKEQGKRHPDQFSSGWRNL